MRVVVAIAVLILAVFLLLASKPWENKEENTLQRAVTLCINLCKQAKEKGMDLSSGPCLSNYLMEGWVCDVAHWPRKDIDNKPENQCSAFREGRAKNFIEVDEECRLIRVYYNGRLVWGDAEHK